MKIFFLVILIFSSFLFPSSSFASHVELKPCIEVSHCVREEWKVSDIEQPFEEIKSFNKRKIIDLLDTHYDDANKWYQRWRLFFLACEMLFSHDQGNEWFVSHYLLEQNK